MEKRDFLNKIMKLAIYQELNRAEPKIHLKYFKGHLLCCYDVGNVFFRGGEKSKQTFFLLKHWAFLIVKHWFSHTIFQNNNLKAFSHNSSFQATLLGFFNLEKTELVLFCYETMKINCFPFEKRVHSSSRLHKCRHLYQKVKQQQKLSANKLLLYDLHNCYNRPGWLQQSESENTNSTLLLITGQV